MKFVWHRFALFAIAFVWFATGSYAAQYSDKLIVSGKRIGPFLVGVPSGHAEELLGEPVSSDGAMGGRGSESWYLGAIRGDKGRPFHRPPDLTEYSLEDMATDWAGHPGKVTSTGYFTTSPSFHTADGISVGSTLDEVRAKYPGIGTDPEVTGYWPLYGNVECFMDDKEGIGFAIRKSDGRCIEIGVVPRGGDWYAWGLPGVAGDYWIDASEDSVGDIKLGMTRAQILSLLGEPDKRDSVLDGEVWSWRVPAQNKDEPPGLAIYFHKLSNGTSVAEQIGFSSPAFVPNSGNPVHVGCTLAEIKAAGGNLVKMDSNSRLKFDAYADYNMGLIYDVRQPDSKCVAITLFSSPTRLDNEIFQALSTKLPGP